MSAIAGSAVPPLLIRNGTVVDAGGLRPGVDVAIENGRIAAVAAGLRPGAAAVIDASGSFVAPGFIDVHVHGAAGAMFEQGDGAAVERISATLARFGVSGFLATIATLEEAATAAAVSAVAAVAGREPGARILGIHLEGPYLSPLRAGAQSVPCMRPPSTAEVDRLQELCGGRVRLITLAPECDEALAFIAAMRRRGIAVSVGHSDAGEAVMLRSVEAGATHVTHLFNAMRGLHHREPGVVGVALTDDRLSVELICDGHHLAPRVVDLALRCKPPGKTVLVSDAVGALGMADGEYEMFGVRCVVGGGAVRLAGSGALAGSCLSLDRAVRNLRAWCPRLPLPELIAAVTAAPAALIGETDCGAITPGRLGDCVILDRDLEVVATICRGRTVWRR